MSDITRTIDTVTAEIVLIRENARAVFFRAVVDIGTRLIEAKELVPQGEWLDYLDRVLGYKPSTAQNYMRIAREYGNGQIGLDGRTAEDVFGKLSYSQLLPLLGLEEEERRELADSTDLADMSSREIERLTRDYKAAKAAEEHASRAAEEAADKAEKAEKAAAKAEKAEEAERAAREAAESKAKQLEGRVAELMEEIRQQPIPAEAAVVPEETALEEAREQVRQEMEQAVEEANQRARDAQEAAERARNPVAFRVKFLFDELQTQTGQLETALFELRQQHPETAGKFAEAISAVLSEAAERMAGV